MRRFKAEEVKELVAEIDELEKKADEMQEEVKADDEEEVKAEDVVEEIKALEEELKADDEEVKAEDVVEEIKALEEELKAEEVVEEVKAEEVEEVKAEEEGIKTDASETVEELKKAFYALAAAEEKCEAEDLKEEIKSARLKVRQAGAKIEASTVAPGVEDTIKQPVDSVHKTLFPNAPGGKGIDVVRARLINASARLDKLAEECEKSGNVHLALRIDKIADAIDEQKKQLEN